MNKEIMSMFGFGEELARIKNCRCPFCRKPVLEENFRDELSKKEFRISGLCQSCQDEYFGE